MTQFELRFQDLLRHGDWEVQQEPMLTPYRELQGYRTVVFHRKGRFYIKLSGGILSDEFDRRIVDGMSRSERKQLSKFAREVVRLHLLKSAFPS